VIPRLQCPDDKVVQRLPSWHNDSYVQQDCACQVLVLSISGQTWLNSHMPAAELLHLGRTLHSTGTMQNSMLDARKTW
jgi:hypothetical protein